MFGRHPSSDEKTTAAWGARAIFKRGYIDLVPDRQQVAGDDEAARKQLLGWLNKKALPNLRKLVKRLSSASAEVIEFDDGNFHIEASPQSSYGYLYIGAWIKG